MVNMCPKLWQSPGGSPKNINQLTPFFCRRSLCPRNALRGLHPRFKRPTIGQAVDWGVPATAVRDCKGPTILACYRFPELYNIFGSLMWTIRDQYPSSTQHQEKTSWICLTNGKPQCTQHYTAGWLVIRLDHPPKWIQDNRRCQKETLTDLWQKTCLFNLFPQDHFASSPLKITRPQQWMWFSWESPRPNTGDANGNRLCSKLVTKRTASMGTRHNVFLVDEKNQLKHIN